MILIINEDAGINVSMSPGEDSIHVEIAECRDSIKHLYIGPNETMKIEFASDGFRLTV